MENRLHSLPTKKWLMLRIEGSKEDGTFILNTSWVGLLMWMEVRG